MRQRKGEQEEVGMKRMDEVEVVCLTAVRG